MTCPDCTTALTRSWHCYVDGCPGCAIRSLADAPRYARQGFLNAIVDDQERETMREALLAEYQRRKAREKAGLAIGCEA